ncbi:MAG: sodium-dependent transporter, partial [Bacteroidales bacterium]|nr:sodium-dependent transporter [Bacteroidales bacterium]
MKPRENFGGRAAVIMALAGSAIGLGNIWRFPYMVGENGGAAFILVYILASLLLLLPIFLAEAVIGRRSRSNAFGAMKALAPHSRWKWTGLFAVLTPMIVLSYYSVVGGWALGYFGTSLTGGFLQSDPEALHGVFASFLGSSWKPVVCFTAFLAISCLIVAGGVKSGIEKFSKYSIPVLFLMIVTMAVFSLSLPGAGEGVRYLIRPDFSKLTASAVAAAVGQGFFSLSLGMGIVITYSSYVKPSENLVASGTGTAIADLLFALLAGFAVMPAVFAAGIEPAAGPGLVFETLPYIFAKMGVDLPFLS